MLILLREDVASLVEWEIDYFKYKTVVQKVPNMIISIMMKKRKTMIMRLTIKYHSTLSMMMI